MVVELLRPHAQQSVSTEDVLRSLIPRDATKTTTSTIHPPTRRAAKHIEPTSALQLARELADTESQDRGLMNKLADLSAIQLRQGPSADRLQLFFVLSRMLSGEAALNREAGRIASVMLTELRPLFSMIAPTLRWTALASLATILDRPCFSATARKLGAGYLCALIPEALEDAAPHDKAAIYSMLSDLHEHDFIGTANNSRILAGLTQYLRIAIRDTNLGLRKQLVKQHISFLESRALKSDRVVATVQIVIREFAASVADTLDDVERDFFERSVRRALV